MLNASGASAANNDVTFLRGDTQVRKLFLMAFTEGFSGQCRNAQGKKTGRHTGHSLGFRVSS